MPNRTAAVELATGQVIISETREIDVFGPRYVTESEPGTIGLYIRGKGLQSAVKLGSNKTTGAMKR